jgi:hypothetical protein
MALVAVSGYFHKILATHCCSSRTNNFKSCVRQIHSTQHIYFPIRRRNTAKRYSPAAEASEEGDEGQCVGGGTSRESIDEHLIGYPLIRGRRTVSGG